MNKRLSTFLRSLLAGALASLADFSVVGALVGLLHLSPIVANVPALLVGAVAQFFGNRYFVFKAKAGNLKRQALLFVATGAVALAFNAVLYHVAVTSETFNVVAHGTLGAIVARFITTNIVFVLWSYPIWRWIFRTTPKSVL